MSSEIDVSYETPDYSAECACAPDGKRAERPMKKVFPTLTIPNNVALAKAVSAGQEFTATVKFRVAEVMIRERADGDDSRKGWDYPGEGVRVEMEVQSLMPQGLAVKEDSGEKDGATAIKNFFRKKAKTANSDDDGDE